MFSLVYFLIGINQNRKHLFISGIALGIAVGIKTTFVFYIIPFAVLMLFFLVKGILKIKELILWSVTVIASWVLLGSYCYIQNYTKYQNVFGAQEFVEGHIITQPSLDGVISNFFKHTFNFMTNQSGIHFYIHHFSNYFNDFTAKIGEAVFKILKVDPYFPETFENEIFRFNSWTYKFSLYDNFALAGLVGFIMPLLVGYIIFIGTLSLFFKYKKLNFRYLISAYLFLGYLITFSYLLRWQPWANRLLMVMVILGMPLLALITNSNRWIMKKLTMFLMIYLMVLLIPATFMNQSKPLVPYPIDRGEQRTTFLGKYEPWRHLPINRDRIGLRYVIFPYDEEFLRKVNAFVPLKSKVGLVVSVYEWEYPLFGEKLQRIIIPLNSENIRKQKFDFIIVDENKLILNQELKKWILKDYIKITHLGRTRKSKLMYLYIPKEI